MCTQYLWKDDIPMPGNSIISNCDDTSHRHPVADHNLPSVTTDDASVPVSAANHNPLQSFSASIMRLRRRRGPRSRSYESGTDPAGETMQESGVGMASPEERVFHMKGQWFFVAEVTDKFAFLIYLVTMSFTIFMILYVVPVYMRNDPVMN